jgi:hypothetical protein
MDTKSFAFQSFRVAIGLPGKEETGKHEQKATVSDSSVSRDIQQHRR